MLTPLSSSPSHAFLSPPPPPFFTPPLFPATSLHPNSDAVFSEGGGVVASTKPGMSSITFSMEMINQAGGVVRL